MSDSNADEGNNGVFNEGNNIAISISECNADIAISIMEYNVDEEKTISTEDSNITKSISGYNAGEEKNKSVSAEGNYTVISISECNGDKENNDSVSTKADDIAIPTEVGKYVNNISSEEACSGDSILTDRVSSLEKTLADVVSRLESVEAELKRVNESPKKASSPRKTNSAKIKSQPPNGKVSQPPTAKVPQSPHGKVPQSPTAKAPQSPTAKAPQSPNGKVPQSPTAKVPPSSNGKAPQPTTAKAPHTTVVRSSSHNSTKASKTLPRSMADISGDAKDDQNGNKEDDGKPKIILKATPKQKKSKVNEPNIDEISQKDEPIKFIIRGRSERLYPPTGYHKGALDGTAPDEKLKVNWVYGYRGRDCRDNLYALPSGEILYNMAGVVVLYDSKKHLQRHFTEHNQFVKCVAVHPNKTIVASGQVAGHGEDRQPHVLVWDSTTFAKLSSFGHGFFERGVGAVRFTTYEEGKYLVAFDDSDNHALSLWDWEKGIKITEAKCSKEKVSGIVCNPIKPESFCTYGQKNLMFWTLGLDQEKMYLKKKSAIYEKVEAPKYVQSVVYNSDGDLVSGDSNGNILLFKLDNNRNKISKSVSAHKGGVFCLHFIEKDSIILSSGKYGQISSWSETLDKLQDFSKIPDQYGPARSISFNSADQTFVIGTTHNCILQYGVELSTETLLVHGHCDEMWGLETHPKEPIFVTCAEDKMVCIWNSESKKILWTDFIEDKAQCAAFHPTSTYLLIGTMNGTISILNYEKKEDKTTIHQLQSGIINDIKISPDGTAFAAACRDTYIYLYSWCDDIASIKKPKILKGHTSRVSHLDWSLDGEYMQTNSNDYELLFWHKDTGSQVVNGLALRDVDWATWTCPIGFPVIGIWPEGADGTDINTCGRSNKKNLIATGDDFGEVKLFRYPCVKPKSENNVGKGHSSHVTCVRFIANDSCLITVGGKDCSIVQWDLVKGE